MIAPGTINGAPVHVVLDSIGTRFADPSRLERARRMREHAREHGQYAVSDGFMIRVSRQRGLSLAAQLEKLLPEHSGLVFIALSKQQVYQAMLHEGLVYTEETRSREEAEQALLADAEQAIVVETAERSGFAKACSGTELALSTAPAWQHKPMWLALLRQGLPHPLHLGALVLPVLLAVLAISGQRWARLAENAAENENAVAAQLAALRDAALQRQHPAGARRQLLFWAEYLEALKAYRAQGLEKIRWDGTTVTLSGPLDQGTLKRLQEIAQGRGEFLAFFAGGWQVEQELVTPEPLHAPPVFEPIDLADWLGRSEPRLRLVKAQLEVREARAGSGYKKYKVELQTERGAEPAYRLLAELLRGIPAKLDSTEIGYVRSLPQRAKLELTVWGI